MRIAITIGIALLGFVALALLAMTLLTGNAESVFDSREWVETPCEVVSTNYEYRVIPNRYRNTGASFYVGQLSFKYETGGQTYVSEKYSSLEPTRKTLAGIEAWMKDIKRTSTCYVNVNDPQLAMLKNPPPPAGSVFVVVPIAFCFLAFMLFFALAG